MNTKEDKEYILALLKIYNLEYGNIVEPTKELIKKSIIRIKHDIKMYSSDPGSKHKSTIEFEVDNLMSLQKYLILNYGIDEL